MVVGSILAAPIRALLLNRGDVSLDDRNDMRTGNAAGIGFCFCLRAGLYRS